MKTMVGFCSGIVPVYSYINNYVDENVKSVACNKLETPLLLSYD